MNASTQPTPSSKTGPSSLDERSVAPAPAGELSPCQRCGACCAAYRVDFHPAELAGGAYAWGEGVPRELTVPVTAQLVRMAGTDAQPPRCVALEGEVGVAVGCSLYASRPSPCREFNPLAEVGVTDEACARARRRHGLAPLPRGEMG
ncbi:YkgJ family cysteine cluster protein [Azospira inquinata]|uniref:YkgJ family cysteine cluster protein n=1 Tax=Azospira inquinata TaxID=2785627 RepID=A0A975XUE3_9RHOO|nr:YkgJ family cysteine cluster protein [Azospira inquinata]QWT45997.1 YkgJ family cysteine cluster protein [Azospira inquinata]QWT48675.1 YkgJ family cysteine cluster protein [Azospira inquinata]